MRTSVANVRFDNFDIYIGRERAGQPKNPWGNPFSHLPNSRAEFTVPKDQVLASYEAWVLAQPLLVEQAKLLLHGKTLGCFCRPAKGFLGTIHLKSRMECILEGGADGADRLCRQWADFYRIGVETFLPAWKSFGKRAGPMRNERMVTCGHAHYFVAFSGGHGTADCVSRCIHHGLPRYPHKAW